MIPGNGNSHTQREREKKRPSIHNNYNCSLYTYCISIYLSIVGCIKQDPPLALSFVLLYSSHNQRNFTFCSLLFLPSRFVRENYIK